MTEYGLDTCLDLVADRNRRAIIRQLRRAEHDETTVDTLVDQLHGGESATGYDPPSDRDALLAQLHHNHLPKLADRDVIDFDPTDGTVRYRAPDRIESVLDGLSDPTSESPPRP